MHTSAKAADVTKLFLLNKCQVTSSHAVYNRNPNPSLTLMKRDPDYHQHLFGSSTAPVPAFQQNLWKSVEE